MKVKALKAFRMSLDELGYVTCAVAEGDVAEVSDDHGNALVRDGLAEKAPKEAVVNVGTLKGPKPVGRARQMVKSE